jgi:hypothetical protein
MVPDNTLENALWYAFRWDKEASRRLFDLIMSQDDKDLFEFCKGIFVDCRDTVLLPKIASAFSTETNPDRRAMLAHVLGGNLESPTAQPVVESILAGVDVRTMEQVLGRMTLLEIGDKPELKSRTALRLRDLVLSGPSANIRVGAAAALSGDFSEEGIRFLIDRVLYDGDPEVQLAALESTPGPQVTRVPLAAERLSAMWTVAIDASRPRRIRGLAAKRVLEAADAGIGSVTPDQKTVLEALAALLLE